MAITNFGPTPNYARFGTVVFPSCTPTTKTLTTAGGVATMTTAELLCGLLRVNCDDAQTYNTPTAVDIVAAINGCQVNTAFDLDIINYGDTTMTLGLGTGVTKVTVATVAAVVTMATLTAKRFKFVVTNVTPGSEAVVVYAFGSTAAAVA